MHFYPACTLYSDEKALQTLCSASSGIVNRARLNSVFLKATNSNISYTDYNTFFLQIKSDIEVITHLARLKSTKKIKLAHQT